MFACPAIYQFIFSLGLDRCQYKQPDDNKGSNLAGLNPETVLRGCLRKNRPVNFGRVEQYFYFNEHVAFNFSCCWKSLLFHVSTFGA